MKITSSRGFTLIELVVVIVILGILAATAAPKFMSLQSDARAASLKGVEATWKSADKMFYAKAVLQGVDKTCDLSSRNVNIDEKSFYSCYGHILPTGMYDSSVYKIVGIDANDFIIVPYEFDDYWGAYTYFLNPEFEKITDPTEKGYKYHELKDKCSVMYKLNPNKDEVIIKSFTSDC
ncbi:type II secretion system protein [Succinimonas sp.]|uniref:type II secretion system protein n=1 Tax=Succinimonas sp. TaxID=1936151 RepID=UPI00387095A4